MVWKHLICRIISTAIQINAAASSNCNKSHLQHFSLCNGGDVEGFLFRSSLLILSIEALRVLLLLLLLVMKE